MLRYHPASALVVVDIQNDFADPAGGLSVRGGDAIIPAVNAEIALALANGARVVCTQDWHPESTPHFAKDGGSWPVHCVADTWGAELHPALVVPPDVPRIRKGERGEDGYSGFTMRDSSTGAMLATPLEAMLREAGVTDVVVVGLATDYCVKATALDAVRLGFATMLLRECVAAVDLAEGDGERALDEMLAAGARLHSVRTQTGPVAAEALVAGGSGAAPGGRS